MSVSWGGKCLPGALMAVEVVALSVRILAERKGLAVQCRHPVFLSWHSVATFRPELSYYAKRFALDLAQSAETWPVNLTGPN